MNWSVEWTGPAVKDLRRLDAVTERRIHAAVTRLAETGHGDIKLLKGRQAEWRLRVGDWRVIFQFDRTTGCLTVKRVRNRSGVYGE